jgi:hypothetical protein
VIGLDKKSACVDRGKELHNAINLVIVFAVRKCAKFLLESLEPWSCRWHKYLAPLKLRRLLRGPVLL